MVTVNVSAVPCPAPSANDPKEAAGSSNTTVGQGTARGTGGYTAEKTRSVSGPSVSSSDGGKGLAEAAGVQGADLTEIVIPTEGASCLL